MLQRATLVPFEPDPEFYAIDVEMNIDRTRLEFSYVIWGAIEQLHFPKPKATATRQDRLWEQTCFEAFLSPRGENAYLEFNFSTNGDWNVFFFEKERGERKLPQILNTPTILWSTTAARAQLDVHIELVESDDLSNFILTSRKLELGVTTILNRTNSKSFWALRHDGPKPDFHVRSSFLLPVQMEKLAL